MNYVKKVAAELQQLIADAPADLELKQLRRLIRDRGPKDVHSAEFAAYHREARRQVNAWIKNQAAAANNETLF